MRIFILFVVLFSCSGPAWAETEASTGCLELLQDRCQKCHYLSRVCQELGEKSERRWDATLERMVKRRGATLSADEQISLRECLVKPDPAIKQECGK